MEWYIKLHRKIIESEIRDKPSDWLKIWIYILWDVFYQDWKKFKTWENFFNYEIVSKQCGVSYRTVQNCLKWLQKVWQVVSQKQSRGVIIKVKNYSKYQSDGITDGNTSGKSDGNTDVITGGNSIRKENKNTKKTNNIIKPTKIKIFEDSSFEYMISDYFINKQKELQNPSFIYLLNKNWEEDLIQKWADEIRKLKEIDKYTEQQISFIINYLFENDFRREQISSMEKFRKKNKSWIPYFVVLINEAKSDKQKQTKTSVWAWLTSYF